MSTVRGIAVSVIVGSAIFAYVGLIILSSRVGHLGGQVKRGEARLLRDETLLRQLCVASGRGASSIGPLTVRGGKVVAGSTVPARTGCAP